MDKESKVLEYKESVTKSYLKTVSAFANYNDGVIIFGIRDDFSIVGIKDAVQACLNIENQINDNIKPRPDFSLKINNNNTISLYIEKGYATPYRYNGKSYVRNNTSTVETDYIQENRLVLEGMNMSYEELPSKNQDLSFNTLSKAITDKLNLSSFNKDIMKSLELYRDQQGYNNAAALLADKNDYAGVDIAVFGGHFNEFRRRIPLNGISILSQYEKSLEIFEEEYIVERIEDGYRKKIELVPFEAYREAIANSIIHRVWDVNANTKVEMYKDRIIVSSPGGLFPEIFKEDYLRGNYSFLRNRIIASVFNRLDIVEIFATGIRRINKAYENRFKKPIFVITDSSISITLPVDIEVHLTLNERKIYDSIGDNYSLSRKDIETKTNLSKDILIRALNSLIEKGLISKEGKGKGTYYFKVK